MAWNSEDRVLEKPYSVTFESAVVMMMNQFFAVTRFVLENKF